MKTSSKAMPLTAEQQDKLQAKLEMLAARAQTPERKEALARARMALAIAERVHKILERRNMTQKELADLMSVPESTVSRILGAEHNATLGSIAKLEAALDEPILVTVDEVCEFEHIQKLVEQEMNSNPSQLLARVG